MLEMKTEKYGQLLVVQRPDKYRRIFKTVFLQGIPVVHFKPHDNSERKLAAIDLVEREHCNQRIAGKICGFHRNTVYKILRTKKLLGIEAVLRDERGLKEPYKYINQVSSHIKQLQRQHPEWTDQAVAEQASNDLEINISRSAVARIRTDNQAGQQPGFLPSKKELLDLARAAEIIDGELYHSRQLLLNFSADPELQQKSEEFSLEPSPQAAKPTERFFIERLQQGERCNFAGGFMHHLFLQEIGFADMMASFPTAPGATYQGMDILATLFHSIHQGIPSIEALKLVNAGELGVLLGLNRIPEKETVRDQLCQLAQQYRSSELIDQFAHQLLQLGQIDPEVFFVDGHFLPYYGLHVIAKGYYTVRRLAMKGNELYAVTDLEGRPLFFINESNEIDFRPIISRCAAKLIDLGISRPLLVFDRGGYGINFFKELSQTTDFVTWAKYVTDKSLAAIPEESFTAGIAFQDDKYLVAEELRTVSESIQTAQKEGRSHATSLELRLVILQDLQTGRRLGIYTSNTSRPASDIAYFMLQRWGTSENFFKEMMDRFNLNYHPGYDIRELEHQPLVNNPDIVLIKKAIPVLKKEVQDQEKDILLIQARLNQRQDKRLVEKLANLHRKLEEKKKDLALLKEKLAILPDKVSIIDLLKGKPMSRCDLEKKKLYDLMQFMAFHSRERLVSILKKCYDDKRDVKKVLDMITTRGGYIKLIGQTLVVILDWIENKKHRDAATCFCRLLNEMSINLVGRLKVRLSFHLSKIPHHGSKSVPDQMHISS
jgi:transposase